MTLSRAVEGTSCTAMDRLSVCSSYAISAVSQAMPLMVICSSPVPTGETPRNTIVQSRRSGTDSTAPSTGEISNLLPPDPVASPSLALSAMSARQSNVIIVSAMCARLAQDTIPSSSRNVKVPSAPGKTSTCRTEGLRRSLTSSPVASSCNGMMPPALANTGMRSSARHTSSRRPDALSET